MSPNTNSQMSETSFQMHATSPWTDWADKFASADFEQDANGYQASQASSDQGCSDALMDCYNG